MVARLTGAKGRRTRQEILDQAMGLASVDGLEALTIGRLAAVMGCSKSGVFAHFGAKQELQLAVVEAAVEVFGSRVVAPVLSTPHGVERVAALCESWLAYARDVFPGGCFFYAAGAEFDARPGPVRDALAAARRDWVGFLSQNVRSAQVAGSLDPTVEPEQLAFELDAFGAAANSAALLLDDASAFDRARTAIRTRLDAVRSGR